MSDLVCWIWFSTRRGLRLSVKQSLLSRFNSPKDILLADMKSLSAFDLKDRELEQLMDKDTSGAEAIAAKCRDEDIRILSIQDAAYPERLRNISDPPSVLYIKGKLPAVDEEAAIAVVGTRKSTPYGDKMARNISYGIAKSGGIVVTGLAGGIDSRGAEGALMAGGTVIGVLGTAIDEIYPRYNRPLFEDVAAVGALVSEYPPGYPMNRLNFPARNRIIAGLSLGTAVIEAPFGSGALITARRALDYGRDVFAVPGNADGINSRGGNALIKEGAKLIENAWDILTEYEYSYGDKLKKGEEITVPEEMSAPKTVKEAEDSEVSSIGKGFFKFRVPIRRREENKKTEAEEENSASILKAQLEGLSEKQLKIAAVMNKPAMHIDDIIDLSQLTSSEVTSELTLLQIKGIVLQDKGKRFTLNIKKRG